MVYAAGIGDVGVTWLDDAHYAAQRGVHIAYRTVGGGPRDLVLFSGWFLPMESMAEEPSAEAFVRRLSALGRVVLFDRRGIGLSDPVLAESPPTLEQWMHDTLTVLDEVGSEKTDLVAIDPSGGFVALLLAATHPDRVASVILFNACARVPAAPDYPWGRAPENIAALIEHVTAEWTAGRAGLEIIAPSKANDPQFSRWWVRARRQGASPAVARALLEMAHETDLRDVLDSVHVPTLVMHRAGSRTVTVEQGRYLAEHIAEARYAELDGSDSLIYVGNTDEVLDEIDEFLTGSRFGPRAGPGAGDGSVHGHRQLDAASGGRGGSPVAPFAR